MSASLDALMALGEAYRGDWSEFDGRQLRRELYSWRELHEATPDDAAAARTWAAESYVCVAHGSFFMYCGCDPEGGETK
jgi:hypothetical protein